MLGKKSNVWSFFTKINNSDFSCNLCGKVYKSSGNTTNVRTHLRNKHPSIFEASFSAAAPSSIYEQVNSASEIEVKPDIPSFTENAGDTGHGSEGEESSIQEAPRKKKKAVRELFLQQVLDKILPPKMHKDDCFGAYVSAQLLTFPPMESDKLKMEIHTLIYNRRLELERSKVHPDSHIQPSQSTSPPPQVVQLASSRPRATNTSTPKSLPLATTVSKPAKCISNKYREHPSSTAKSPSTQPLPIGSPSQSPKSSSITQTSSLSKFLQLSPSQSNSCTSSKNNSVQSNSSCAPWTTN